MYTIVEVEESGPLRAVIRCEGAFEADVPAHHYGGYRPLRFVIRLYAYAGQAFLRVLHTVIVACNSRETEVEEIGLQVPIQLAGPARYRIGSVLSDGVLRVDQTLLLSQRLDNHFRLDRYQGLERRTLAEGDRAEGWLALEGDRAGVGVGLRYMVEEYPKALAISGQGDGISVYLWRDPDGRRLNFRRYDEAIYWERSEGVYADGTGTAKTSEFFLTFYHSETSARIPDLLRGLLQQPRAAIDPAWLTRCEAMGGFAPYDGQAFPAAEQMMADFITWAERNIHLGRWYGFFDWGDMLVNWDEESSDWRFEGRWGWCNSEWDPRYGIWIQALRTGQAHLFNLAEAMTRHSVDVDTCHFHPFRPYWVGGCFRHSTDHFGDEPCASHTFIDNWVVHYYLTGDLRTLEVLRLAGEFFLRYRWSEDPSASLT